MLPRTTSTEHSARVATTIFPLQDITQNIVGDTMDVELILPPGASPHTFEISPSTLRKLDSTEVIFSIGNGLDNWTNNIAQSLKVDVVVVDQNINLRSGIEIDEPTDPHYYLDFNNAIIISQTITETLSKQFPEYANIFKANEQAYILELEKADSEIHKKFEPMQNRHLITLHDAWYYFANAYDLRIVGTFTPTPGREPTPQYLIDLQEAVSLSNVNVLYTEPQLSTDTIQAFIEDNNLKIATLDPIGGFSDRQSYIQLMQYNANIIYNNQK